MPETTREQRRGRKRRSHEGHTRGQHETAVHAAHGGHSAAMVIKAPKIVISGDPQQYSAHVRETARALYDTAKDGAQDLQLQMIKACEDFKRYAAPKISKLAGEITAGELLITLATIPARVVIGEIADKVASKLGQAILRKYIDEGVKSAGAAASRANSHASDAEALTTALDTLIKTSSDGSLMIADAADKEFAALSERLFDHANDAAPLSDEDQAILNQFYLASPKAIRTGLTTYGLPESVSLKQLYLKLYTDLVEGFEMKYVWATASFREQVEMVAAERYGATELTQRAKAHKAATDAGKARSDELSIEGGQN